ncbi:MAG: hypothetical protein HQK56_17250 [Deltaproteobacteria bacterium]|nr:hypothetical protein [Deltaproteobacteria bacterium]
MHDQEIVQKLLGGASLRTFMIPDPFLPSNRPEHWEVYDLPHIIINGDYFWAKSRTEHLFHLHGQGIQGTGAFGYTNICDAFCDYDPATGKGKLMYKKRYKEHRWVVNEDWIQVWSSKENGSKEMLIEKIKSAARFKIAMLDSEGVWNIHPVDLPCYFPGDDYFQLKTVFDGYPFFFRSPDNTKEIYDRNLAFLAGQPKENTMGTMEFQDNVFYTFYMIFSDGKYYNMFDIPRGSFQEYLELRVFAEK